MISALILSVLLPAASAEILTSEESLLERPIEQRVKAFRQLKDHGYKFLSRTAFDAKEALQTRWRAITTMGRLDPMRFRTEIDKALASRDWFVRNAGLIALLSDDRKRAVEISTKMLTDPALVVRTQAVRNMIALNARESEAILWRVLYEKRNYKGNESLWIRAHVAEALSKFAGPGRTKQFERMLLDADPRLHKWAINGLETTTGLRMSSKDEPLETRRQKWLSRLGVTEI